MNSEYQLIMKELRRRKEERIKLRKLASKITKTPAKINVPIEYMTGGTK